MCTGLCFFLRQGLTGSYVVCIIGLLIMLSLSAKSECLCPPIYSVDQTDICLPFRKLLEGNSF